MDSGQERIRVGDEVSFQLNYSALVRAMTSPFIGKVVVPDSEGGLRHTHDRSHK